MSWSRTQARVDHAAAKKAATYNRPPVTHFAPDDLSYLRALKSTLTAAGLMPLAGRYNGLVSEKMYRRACAVRERLDALVELTGSYL